MQVDLRLAIWNANGILNHLIEIEIFLKIHFIDILLISETHLTDKSYFKIRNYDLITANHPHNRAHAGAAILIRSTLKYEELEAIQTPSIQAAGIKVATNNFKLSIYSIYSPPRHNITFKDYSEFFKKIDQPFMVGGDYNAKHPWWGSRLINPKGRELYKCLNKDKYNVLSTGSPTYWPNDPLKIPDLLDFVVYKGVNSSLLDMKSSYELNSDHSPLLLTIQTTISYLQSTKLINNKTNIDKFQYILDQKIDLNTRIKSETELDWVVENFITDIHEAAFVSTRANSNTLETKNLSQLSEEIRNLIQKKRKLRKHWQKNRSPQYKTLLNKATKDLKEALVEYKNNTIRSFLKSLNNAKGEPVKVWRATKYLKHPVHRKVPIKNIDNTWCRSEESKASAFASYLESTFSAADLVSTTDFDIANFLDVPCQMSFPIKPVTEFEVSCEIEKLNIKKSAGYDKIDGLVVKKLIKKAVTLLTLIYNSMLRLNHFPSQWKCAEVIMLHKPNKSEHDVKSYRPISLLPTFSKIFERIFSRRLLPIIKNQSIIPEHQFGFRKKHSTIEQCHRVVKVIRDALEAKKFCSAVFLDVKQAFDKVWHVGLLYKIKKLLPMPFYLLLKSYITDRYFYVRINDVTSKICKVSSGVPQGSVLGPLLYTLFTSDLPSVERTEIATYADDTAILTSDECAINAASIIQAQLDCLQIWLMKWKIRINTEKSQHITFTLKKGNCPSVKLYNVQLPQTNSVKYLGMILDSRLTWKDHIKSKRLQLDRQMKRMYWLLNPTSELNIDNKLLLYKAILKPIWTYGVQLWGTASNSNIEILQRFQHKALRLLTGAPWFVSNRNIHKDLNMLTIKEEIRKLSDRYLYRLSCHENLLAVTLLDDTNEIKRLKRHHVLDLPFRI